MSMKFSKKTAVLEGQVAVEAAEELAEWLKKTPKAVVNLSGVENVHAAVLQVLLALRPKVQGEPADPWLCAALRTLAQSH